MYDMYIPQNKQVKWILKTLQYGCQKSDAIG